MDKNKTTEKIKNTLGASYTIAQVERFVYELQKKIENQAPYFNGRDLDKLELLRESLKSEINLTCDAKDFLETLLWVASENEKDTRYQDGKSVEDGELYEKTIYDFSDKFKIAVCNFCWSVKDEILEIEGVEDELEKCSRSFGGNLFFSLTGHGCGFFDESYADTEKIESAIFSFVNRYQLEDLENMLWVDDETGKIDLCFTPEAIEEYRDKYFKVRETDSETVLA